MANPVKKISIVYDVQTKNAIKDIQKIDRAAISSMQSFKHIDKSAARSFGNVSKKSRKTKMEVNRSFNGISRNTKEELGKTKSYFFDMSKNAKKEFKKVVNSSKHSANKVQENFKKVDLKKAFRLNGFQKASMAVGVAGTAAFAGITAFAIKSASAMENAEAAFTPLMGGAEKAQMLIKRLNKEAATTPFQFESISKVAKQLLPVMAGDINKVADTFRMLGDTAGGNAQKLDSITRGFTKAMLKGKVDMESLNMIGEAGVPIFTELADSMGKKVNKEFFKMISAGKVTTKDLTKAFKTMTSEGGIFFNGMAISSKTFSGVMSTLKDNATLAAAEFGKELLPVLKELSADMIKFVQSAEFKQITKDIAALAKEFIKKLFPFIKKMIPLATKLMKVFIGMGPAMQGLTLAAGALAPAIGVIAPMLMQLIPMLGTALPAGAAASIAAIGPIAGVVGGAAIAIGVLVKEILDYKKAVDSLEVVKPQLTDAESKVSDQLMTLRDERKKVEDEINNLQSFATKKEGGGFKFQEDAAKFAQLNIRLEEIKTERAKLTVQVKKEELAVTKQQTAELIKQQSQIEKFGMRNKDGNLKLSKDKDKLEDIKQSLKELKDKEIKVKVDLKQKQEQVRVGGGIQDSKFFEDRKKAAKKVNDAIIRPDGQVIETDPKDTLIAAKDLSGSFGQMSQSQPSNNVTIKSIIGELKVMVNGSAEVGQSIVDQIDRALDEYSYKMRARLGVV